MLSGSRHNKQAILKIQLRKKLQSHGLWFLGYFYNVLQPPKVYIDPFTNVNYTWNVFLAT